MGSHTDYNDGFVATMTVDRDTWLLVRPRSDRRVRIASLNLAGTAEFSLDAIEHDPDVTGDFAAHTDASGDPETGLPGDLGFGAMAQGFLETFHCDCCAFNHCLSWGSLLPSVPFGRS